MAVSGLRGCWAEGRVLRAGILPGLAAHPGKRVISRQPAARLEGAARQEWAAHREWAAALEWVAVLEWVALEWVVPEWVAALEKILVWVVEWVLRTI